MIRTSTHLLILITSYALLSFTCGCGGGSRGGGITVGSITVQGLPGPVFVAGMAPGPVCLGPAGLNGLVEIRLGGPVDAASLPPDGAALGGAVEIVDLSSGIAAQGMFRIDPADAEVVQFFPTSPMTTQAPCLAGMTPATIYMITVHGAANGGPTLTSSGRPIVVDVVACFSTAACPGPGAIVDPVATAPAIVASTPALGQGAPTVDAAALGLPTTISLDVDQPLDPATVNAASVELFDMTSNPSNPVPIGATISFMQFGSIPGEAVSRIFVTLSGEITDAVTYEVRVAGLTDFAGIPIAVTPGELLFSVADQNDDAPTTFKETFDDQTNVGTLIGAITWGGGMAAATFPLEITGNGLDGAGTFGAPMTINTDTVLTPGDPNATPGAYNFTNLAVNADLTFTSTTDTAPGESNFAVKLRSQGTTTIAQLVRIDCRGRPGSPGQQFSAPSVTLPGGWGGPGAGAGGNASPVLGARSPMGEPGGGGHVDPTNPGMPGGGTNTDASSPFFGGGGGGAAGEAATFAAGAAGGGGGSASSFSGYGPTDPVTFFFRTAVAGGRHNGTDGMGLGAPPAGRPTATPPPAMIPPLMGAVGGSGAGAGGDRVINLTPMSDNPGGAGGGGGGAARFSGGGTITIGDAVEILCSGGDGGVGIGFFIGSGGGGSGGSVVVTTFAQVALGLGVLFDAGGGDGGNETSTMLGFGGHGGDGVVQLEDSDGFAVMDFVNNATIVLGEVFAQPLFLGSSGVEGRGRSVILDTGSTGTDYTSLTFTGMPEGGVAEVHLTGFAEDPGAPGMPATSATSATGAALIVGPVDATDLDMLDGLRFFRFEVSLEFPLPPATAPGDRLPVVTDVCVGYTAR